MSAITAKKYSFLLAAAFLIVFFLARPAGFLKAETAEELRQKIEEKTNEIKKLEEEEAKIQENLLIKQKEGATLKEALSIIDNTLRSLRSEISITEKKIQKTSWEIESLNIEITEKEETIIRQKKSLAGILQALSEGENESLLEVIMKNNFLSDFFGYLNSLDVLRGKLISSIAELRSLKEELALKKQDAEYKKADLVELNGSLKNKKLLQEGEKNKQSEILKITKNQENLYQRLLAENQKRRRELEQEINEFEQQIKITIDPSILPSKGSGILGWPLGNLSLSSCFGSGVSGLINCITQFFGNTSFALAGAYNGKGHNGVDFRAGLGSPVFASEDGTVRDTGDTDIGCKGASYGKWILIDHKNNLATLYAHLSSIQTIKGEAVKRGQLIGYSGTTGYATGPHLHFAVFAKQAVKVEGLRSRVCGRIMILPLSPFNGYLNPLDYL